MNLVRCTVVLGMLWISGGWAQDHWRVEHVGSALTEQWSYGHAVAVQGGYAFVAAESWGMRVLDVSDPAHPVHVGYVDTPGRALGIAINGNYVYLADESAGLRVIDVSIPTSPHETNFFDTPGASNDVAIQGNYAYVADNYSGLRIIDISNPGAPVESGFYVMPDAALGVAVAGNYAYIADNGVGLRIINISNPAAPVESGYYDTPGIAYDVAVNGTYAYIADSQRLRVIDISNPAAPFESGTYAPPDNHPITNVTASGTLAYLSRGSGGVYVVNVSNPANPNLSWMRDTPGSATGVATTDIYTYVADGSNGLRIISNLTHTEAGFYNVTGSAAGVDVGGIYAYVADYARGLRILDISNAALPVEVGSYVATGVDSTASQVAVQGNYAYISEFFAGVRILNVSNPAAPAQVSYYDPPGAVNTFHVVLRDNYAFVNAGTSGVQILDVSNPAAPSVVGVYNSPGTARDVDFSGQYGFVADGLSGLRVVNFSDPALPLEVGALDTTGSAEAVTVSGNYAYVANNTSGLLIVNISNPVAPILTSFYHTSYCIWDVEIIGHYAVAADDYNGVRVIDVSDPADPLEVGYYNTPGFTRDVVLRDNLVFAADGNTLEIGDISQFNSPSNDACTAAVELSVNDPDATPGTTVGATQDCPENSAAEVWYSFSVGHLSDIQIRYCGASLGDALPDHLYSGSADSCCEEMRAATSWDYSACGADDELTVHFNGLPIGSYLLPVWTSEPQSFYVQVVEVPTVPANDRCANALPIELYSTVQGTTTRATNDSIPACPWTVATGGMWYRAVGTGNRMQATTCGMTTFNTRLSIFECDCSGLTCVASNDDATCQMRSIYSVVEWCSAPSEDYLILVHSATLLGGDFELTVFDYGSGCSPQEECTRPPEPPVVAAQYFDTALRLTWHPVTGATSYEVRYADTPGGAFTHLATTTDTSLTIQRSDEAMNRTIRFFQVAALSE